MITFRDVVRRECVEEKLAYFATRISLGDAEGAFLEAGELEQGILDSLHPSEDGWGELEQLLRRLTCEAGAAYLASRTGSAPREHLRLIGSFLEQLLIRELPPCVQVRAPEGYIHYALDPMGYARAAERYAADAGRARAVSGVVIGVRSIGTSLSGIAGARLGAEHTVTMRAYGATGRRRVRASLVVSHCETIRLLRVHCTGEALNWFAEFTPQHAQLLERAAEGDGWELKIVE